MWQQIWFIVNFFFVASLIVFLFMQRSYSEAKNSRQADRTRRFNRLRIAFGIASVVLFLAMSASFLINMRLNG